MAKRRSVALDTLTPPNSHISGAVTSAESTRSGPAQSSDGVPKAWQNRDDTSQIRGDRGVAISGSRRLLLCEFAQCDKVDGGRHGALDHPATFNPLARAAKKWMPVSRKSRAFSRAPP
jgi:hypothetical protein